MKSEARQDVGSWRNLILAEQEYEKPCSWRVYNSAGETLEAILAELIASRSVST